MKHLLEAIDSFSRSANRRHSSTINELKQLVAEIREGTDEKNNVQEFYDTLERVVNEIRSMTEHSAAFLQRVRKAEAPNYYDIIKKPMDLGTILKKVKTQQYKTKKAFGDDMTLIWDNCLEYNSYVEHPLRRSANILRQRTDHLLQFVTDLPVKPVRAGSVADEEIDAEGDTDEEADETDKTRKGTASRKRNYRAGTEEEKPKREPSFLSREVSIDPDDTPAETDRSRSPSIVPSNKRRRLLQARTDLLPFEERPALIRTPQGMSSWQTLESLHPIASSSSYTLDDPPRPVEKPLPLAIQQLTGKPAVPLPDEDPDHAWWEAASKEEMLVNALPRVPFCEGKEERIVEEEMQDQSRLSKSIRRNIGTMGKMKKLNAELLGYADQTETDQALPDELDTSEAHVLPQPSIEAYASTAAPETAFIVMQAAIKSLAGHAGFDVAHRQPLDVLSGMALSYIQNIGKTFQLLLDMFGGQWTSFDIIAQALSNNGVESLGDLQHYIKHDVHGQGKRLDRLLVQLETARAKQLASTTKERDGGAQKDDLDAAAVDSKQDDMQAESKREPRFSPPPPAIPLASGDPQEAIGSQIGLLQPFLQARSQTDFGLADDADLENKPKVPRPKILQNGRIPVRLRRQPEVANQVKKKVKATPATTVMDLDQAS